LRRPAAIRCKGTALALEATRRAGVDLLLSRDLESDLAGAGLFLYLTHSEGLGSAILMAMAAGVPVIASNVGGIPEIVRHRENGWLAENEPEPIAAAIRELLVGSRAGPRLAARGRQTVAEKFSLDQMIHNTIHLYRQVLSC
jgi:glycosyltransferase involved in cell wall biosynthesis